MRYVLNSKKISSPAASVCVAGLSSRLKSLGYPVAVNDWSNYHLYDVAIFMATDNIDIKVIRKFNPKILIGIADPKPSNLNQVREANFCIVSSIEQREVFLPFNRNQFIYYMIPDFKVNPPVVHMSKSSYRIVYHGNKIHLNGSYLGLIPALNELGKKYSIQFDAIYNISELGIWSMGRPDPRYCPTRDLQWYPDCYKDYFRDADIGVVQNHMPWRSEKLIKKFGMVSKALLLESPLDHIVKYKSSANAGRAFVFGCFGIPVVADAIPATCDAISDGYSGRLVLNAEGWYDALEDLINSSECRQMLADNFRKVIAERFSPEHSAGRLVDFISKLESRPPVIIRKKSPSLISALWRLACHKIQRKLKHVKSI
jgi:glycosyltransferase involved in cell wall biosynthesis